MSILIIGSLNTDLITTTPRLPLPGETLTSTSFTNAPGGKGANQAVACGRLSSPDTTVSMIGAVGTDTFAAPLLSALSASRVDTSRITASPSPTGTAVILVDSGTGENRILIHPGANATVQVPDDVFTSAQWAAVVLQLEIPVSTVVRALRLARSAGVKTVFNPAPAVAVPEGCWLDVDWCVVNETEAAMLTGVGVEVLDGREGVEGAARELRRRGCGAVVVTLGGRGCYWCDSTDSGWVEAGVASEEVVDTTGAGDTFVGALAVAVVEGRGAKESVEFARTAAGIAVRKFGAMAGVPWRKEIEV